MSGIVPVAIFMAAIVSGTLWATRYASDMGLMEWHAATLAHATESPLASPEALLASRAICCAVVWFTCGYVAFSKTPVQFKLETRTVSLMGVTRFATFTVWCWTLMGVYFLMATAMSIVRVFMVGGKEHLHDNMSVPELALIVMWVLYELSFAMSLLVTVVVTFVLIPLMDKLAKIIHSVHLTVLTDGSENSAMFQWSALVMHNLNLLFMLIELALNGMRFVHWHVGFVILYGSSYVFFSWYWYKKTGVFYYFFLDYDRRRYAVVPYALLMMAVAMFFALGDQLSSWLKPRVDF